MVFVDYKSANNVELQLQSALWANDTTAFIADSKESLLPWSISVSNPVKITIVWYESVTVGSTTTQRVIRREVAHITAVSSNQITIVRRQESCPFDYQATTQTTTTSAFESWDYIYLTATDWHFQNINDEIVNINTNYLTKAEYQAADPIYDASSTWNDDYVITLDPVPASYDSVRRVFLKPDVSNTGAATLNVNSLWTKTIKKFQWWSVADLSSGDLQAGRVEQLFYDGTYFQLSSIPGVTPTVDIDSLTESSPESGDFGIFYDTTGSANYKFSVVPSDTELSLARKATNSQAGAWVATDVYTTPSQATKLVSSAYEAVASTNTLVSSNSEQSNSSSSWVKLKDVEVSVWGTYNAIVQTWHEWASNAVYIRYYVNWSGVGSQSQITGVNEADNHYFSSSITVSVWDNIQVYGIWSGGVASIHVKNFSVRADLRAKDIMPTVVL